MPGSSCAPRIRGARRSKASSCRGSWWQSSYRSWFRLLVSWCVWRPFPATRGSRRERPYPHQHLGVVATVEVAVAVEPGFVCHGRAETSRHTVEQAPGRLVARGDRCFEEAHAGTGRSREDVRDESLREPLAARRGRDRDLPEEPGGR